MRDLIKFYIRHCHVLKKLNFDLLIPPQGQGVGSEGKIFDTMLLKKLHCDL